MRLSIQQHSLRVCGACVCLFVWLCLCFIITLTIMIVVIGRFLFWFYCNGNGNLPGQKSAMPHQTSKVSQTNIKSFESDFANITSSRWFPNESIEVVFCVCFSWTKFISGDIFNLSSCGSSNRFMAFQMCKHSRTSSFAQVFIRISAIKHFQRQVYASLNTNDIDWRKHSYTNHHSHRVEW